MLQARFFYRTESGLQWPDSQGNPTEKRRLTFAYTYNQDTGHVQFGASVHRDTDPRHSYQRSAHRNTALGRLARCPRSFYVEPHTLYADVEAEIRIEMRAFGARGPRLNVPRHVEVIEKAHEVDGRIEVETIIYTVSEE
jgi:hypothetical protein